VNPLGSLVLGSFWTTVALLTALAEWTLACSAFGAPAATGLNVAAVLALFALNRAACWWYEHEAHHAPGRNAVGWGVLVVGAACVAATGALAATVALRVGLATLGGFPAEAGALGVVASRPSGVDLLALASMTVAVGFVLHGYLRGWRALEVTHLEVTIPGLGAGVDGLRIAHLSDLHVGPLCDAAALREAFDTANGLGADLMCVTGDLADSRHTDLERWMPELARLRAPLGVVAILGNHDVAAGLDRVADALGRHTDWRLLRDEVWVLERDGASLAVAGFEHRRLPAALAELPSLMEKVPAELPCVLLAHHPGTVESPGAARAALLLAGHTHGGQIALPGAPRWNMARVLMTSWDVGTFREGSTILHVSRGLGTSGQRVRIGAAREITLITLRAG
jgi:predicted MPP superfamily phosphohydrolase